MIKFLTYHKQVWLVGKDIKVPEPDTVTKTSRGYVCPSNYICIVYSGTLNVFKLFIGYKAPKKESVDKIISLALSLDVKKIEIEKLERIADLKYWDKLVNNLNTKLLASPDLFS